jgi:competence ComEA-like helix-hairpin-helix protein
MKKFTSHFWYNKRQRNGILFLIGLILAVQFLYFFWEFNSDEKIVSVNNSAVMQQRIDSLKSIANQQPTIFPFNPNFISDFKGYQLGMSLEEIDKLLTFRKTGAFVNSSEEFQQVTQISDSLLDVISPYFKFPEWVNTTKKTEKSSFNNKEAVEISTQKKIKKDINTATENDLQKINGIGDKLAKRIVSYRELLQGYTYDEQLYEVYYLDEETAKKVLQHFSVLEKPTIDKLNLNEATFKEILHLPYIDYALTQRIFNYKREVHKIENLEELKKIDSFPLEKFDRIALYLNIE